MTAYELARNIYAEWGVDVEAAIAAALSIPISVHCWQADDVAGFEVKSGDVDSGGIMATGNYPGRARNGDELRQDYDKVFSLVPGVHRANLHAIYAETNGLAIGRDELQVEHFERWIDWANSIGIGLDFNPTYFAHPKAASGYTLSSADDEVRSYWIRHGIVCRSIAAAMASRQGSECVINHWIPDGSKDATADRWSPRARLVEALDEILNEPLAGCTDAVESKLFGLGSEDYVVGSFEFYSSYALSRDTVFCLDMGHVHPTETISDKLSALMQFHPRVLLHTSRPMRWDSDHVVLFNDDLRAVFSELGRGDAFGRAIIALDFFDASINRIGAYVVGVRATRKAILSALLEPAAELRHLELEGKNAQKLALMEEFKTLPFGAIWDELCHRADVPVGRSWISEMETYEERVLSAR